MLPNAGESTAFAFDLGHRVACRGAERHLGRKQSRALADRCVDGAVATVRELRPGDRWPTGSGRSGCSVVNSSGCHLRREGSSGGSIWSGAAPTSPRASARSGSPTTRRQAVVRVDAAAGSDRAHVRRRRERRFGVAVGADAVWAASDDGTVVRIDPENDDVTVVRVGGAPRVVGRRRRTRSGCRSTELTDVRRGKIMAAVKTTAAVLVVLLAGLAAACAAQRRWGRAGRVAAVRSAPVRGRGRAGRRRSSPTSRAGASAPRRAKLMIDAIEFVLREPRLRGG